MISWQGFLRETDNLYVNSNADNFAKCGGNYGNTSNSGVWNRNVNYNLSNSNNNVGFSDSIRK